MFQCSSLCDSHTSHSSELHRISRRWKQKLTFTFLHLTFLIVSSLTIFIGLDLADRRILSRPHGFLQLHLSRHISSSLRCFCFKCTDEGNVSISGVKGLLPRWWEWKDFCPPQILAAQTNVWETRKKSNQVNFIYKTWTTARGNFLDECLTPRQEENLSCSCSLNWTSAGWRQHRAEQKPNISFLLWLHGVSRK